jgi:hypothetical protein
MNNKKNTSAQELSEMANILSTASLKSKIDVSVEFNTKIRESIETIANVVFFKGGDCLILALCPYYTVEKNTKLLNNALALMEDSTRFEEIKNSIENERLK